VVEGPGEAHYRGGFDFSGQLQLARELRQKATPVEALAWELLRDRRFLDLKFRRQHQIGDYVVDFYCDEKQLVVELDGAVHDTEARKTIDHKRDAYLQSLGLTVHRIRNEHLIDRTEAILQTLAAVVNPSPAGRGVGVRVNRFRDRRGETLFIDARKLGRMVDRTHRELTDEELTRIANTYHSWKQNPLPLGEGQGEGPGTGYADVPGFCRSVPLDDIRKHGYVLTPGRYVGAEAQEDDGEAFGEKMKRLAATLREQQAEAAKLDAAIAANLKELGYGG
jgi:very-short-patch-repair endonuclease